MIVMHLVGLVAKLYLSHVRRWKMDSIVCHFQDWPPQNQTLSILLACRHVGLTRILAGDQLSDKHAHRHKIHSYTCTRNFDHAGILGLYVKQLRPTGLLVYITLLLDCLHLPIIIYYCSAYTHMVSLYMISDCLLTHNVVHNFKIGLLAQLEGTINLTTTRLEV